MEIIDNGKQPEQPRSMISARNAYIGVVLIAAGVIWMGYELDIFGRRFFDIVFSWQTLLMIIGGYLLSLGKKTAGILAFAIGLVYGLIDWFGLSVKFNGLILPFVVIVAGVAFLLRGNSK